MDEPRSWPPDRPDRPPLPGRGKLAWRLLWVTTAFLAVALVAAEIAAFGAAKISEDEELPAIAFVLAVFISNYWCIFLLIYFFQRTDLQNLKWRVWTAWLGITAPIIWYLIYYGRGLDPEAAGMLLITFLGPILLSPVATLIGALAGDLLLRLYRARRIAHS